MKITVKQLESIVNESIKASAAHLKKENVRESIQTIIISQIKNGEISSQEELNEFIQTIDMSTRALKMIPFDVFVKLTKK